MLLLIEFGYPALKSYAKLSVTITVSQTIGDITFTVSPAIPLTSPDGEKILPECDIYAHIYPNFAQVAELYETDQVRALAIRIYVESKKDKKDRHLVSNKDLTSALYSSLLQAEKREISPIIAKKIRNKKSLSAISFPGNQSDPSQNSSPGGDGR